MRTIGDVYGSSTSKTIGMRLLISLNRSRKLNGIHLASSTEGTTPLSRSPTVMHSPFQSPVAPKVSLRKPTELSVIKSTKYLNASSMRQASTNLIELLLSTLNTCKVYGSIAVIGCFSLVNAPSSDVLMFLLLLILLKNDLSLTLHLIVQARSSTTQSEMNSMPLKIVR